jgi:hypothetical protein
LWTSSPTWIQKIAMLQLMRITTCLELVQGRAKDSWENGGKTCHEQKQEKRFVNFLLLLESTKSSSYASINSHNNLLELMQGHEIFVSKWRKTYHEQNKRIYLHTSSQYITQIFFFLDAASPSEIASKLTTLRMNLIIKIIELFPFHFRSWSAPR